VLFKHKCVISDVKLLSNPSNTNGVNEARKVLAIALKEASLVPDIYLSTVDFEIAHGTNCCIFYTVTNVCVML